MASDSSEQETKRTRGRKAKPGASKDKSSRKRRVDDSPEIASPAAAGPAGAVLEGHVGAQYLLPLLSGGEARGLPGVVVTRVAFQRASLAHPMDDVIVTGHDRQGTPATLELQAKRTITFTASNAVFADVTALACRTMSKPDFLSTRYELAVAISRTSTTIEQHVQETLRWAREYQEPTGFFDRLNQSGAADQSMRDFVKALRGHMATAGAASDDANVWLLLSRFQVLAFDFEQPGSACVQLARERCAMQLAPSDAGRAGELWDSLQQIALETDARGGDLDADALRQRLTSERGYRLKGDRRLYDAREQLAENADNALATISTRVGKASIERTSHVDGALSALEHGRYLEIRGAGGVGKSGVLVQLAERVQAESRVVVVAPNRIPGGGWAALKAQLGCDATARELLTDLAGDGGGTLFIDGIDRFENPGEKQTVVDLLRAAAQVRGFRVVATARLDFDADARAWLPAQALQELGAAPPILIPELADDEVAQLRKADPALAALLAPGHPAKILVRNLYRLDRLARSTRADASTPFSEAQMAWQWWTTGDSADGGAERLDRRRLLRSLAIHSLTSSGPMDASAESAQAITALIESGSLREINTARLEPAHDVLRDWAIGCLLYEEPERVDELTLSAPAPVRLVRGVELAARLHTELGNGMTGWQYLLQRVSGPEAHGSWKRAVLLALVRSERALEALQACLPALAADNAALFGDLVRATITVDSEPAAPRWAAFGLDTTKLSGDFVLPRGSSWLNLILWSYGLEDSVPHGAVPPLVDLYNRWCLAGLGQDPLSPLLVGRMYAWLIEVESKNHLVSRNFRVRMDAGDAPGLSLTRPQEDDLRVVFLGWCKLQPDNAKAYLQRWQVHPHRHVMFRKLLSALGSAPEAAPEAVANLFLAEFDEADDKRDHGLPREALSRWNTEYFPASPARAPFFKLLQADRQEGLRLIQGVVAHAIQSLTEGLPFGNDRVDIVLPTGRRSFPWRGSYPWARGHSSQVVASALMALEAWAHMRIEAGDDVHAVISDVLGPEGAPAANLLVAVDVMLSHVPKTLDCLSSFAASAELLALDRERFAHDGIGDMVNNMWVRPEPAGLVKRADLCRRPSRGTSLDEILFHFGVYGPEETRDAMRQTLREEAAQLGAPDDETGPTDPRFAAMSALNRLDPANYIQGEDEQGTPIRVYQLPQQEALLRANLQAKGDRGNAEMVIRLRVMRALDEPPCSPELLEQGVAWAKRERDEQAAGDDDREWKDRTRLIVAALALRDGAPALKSEHGEWARALLLGAAAGEADANGIPQQLPYNSRAIAAVGLLAAYRDDHQQAMLERLLNVAVQRDTNMVVVMRAELAAQRSVQPELLNTLARLGLISAIYAMRNRDEVDWETIEDYRAHHEAQEAARRDAERSRLERAVAAELQWLAGEGHEPAWPELPDPLPPKERPFISLNTPRLPRARRPESPREYALDSRAAAGWLSLAKDLWCKDQPEKLRALVLHCWPWTAAANGVGCEDDEEAGEDAHEWNDAYFAAAVAAGATLGDAGIAELVLESIAQLPQERFFDAAEAVLHEIDRLWLGDGLVSDDTVLMVRETLAERLRGFWPWKRLVSAVATGIEMHLAGAIAAMFMGLYALSKPPRCYLPGPSAIRADVLLPLLLQLAVEASGSFFVAEAAFGVLEVEPSAHRLPFMATLAEAWWRAHRASPAFWIDHGFGKRTCEWIEAAVLEQPVSRDVLDGAELTLITDILLQCGTPLARALDERLAVVRSTAAG
ncbi:hypothetical protein KY487_15020 [Ralstonia pseudosolanacearum]|uniref:hypothetical protein n=1 Tax=Ralstonia pseudosolanacearum TaxID=1310165 RepID=UPI001C8C2526|nr:hypothetical protein [Ralstonia pseudosolanacearum]MBX9430573.1 hypothetical protein [Ralstonia pseudosolanacearum]